MTGVAAFNLTGRVALVTGSSRASAVRSPKGWRARARRWSSRPRRRQGRARATEIGVSTGATVAQHDLRHRRRGRRDADVGWIERGLGTPTSWSTTRGSSAGRRSPSSPTAMGRPRPDEPLGHVPRHNALRPGLVSRGRANSSRWGASGRGSPPVDRAVRRDEGAVVMFAKGLSTTSRRLPSGERDRPRATSRPTTRRSSRTSHSPGGCAVARPRVAGFVEDLVGTLVYLASSASRPRRRPDDLRQRRHETMI